MLRLRVQIVKIPCGLRQNFVKYYGFCLLYDVLNKETFIELKQTSVKEVPITVKIGPVSIELYSGFQAETLREGIAAIRTL